MREAEPPLRSKDVRQVLATLAPLIKDRQVVLVGGQALAFWSARLTSPGETTAVVSSKDIDFEGTVDAARQAAKLLGTRAMIPSAREPTPITGVITFVDSDGRDRFLDFIRAPHGLNAEDVRDTAIQVSLPGPDEQGEIAFWVMHPERCMESRVYNTIGLDRTDENGLTQLRASIPVARRWSEHLLSNESIDDRAGQRAVLDLNERIFEKCCTDRRFLAIHDRHNVDPFDAVLDDERLPDKFRARRYPQMRERLKEIRSQ